VKLVYLLFKKNCSKFLAQPIIGNQTNTLHCYVQTTYKHKKGDIHQKLIHNAAKLAIHSIIEVK
jgi:hypothetical protein